MASWTNRDAVSRTPLLAACGGRDRAKSCPDTSDANYGQSGGARRSYLFCEVCEIQRMKRVIGEAFGWGEHNLLRHGHAVHIFDQAAQIRDDLPRRRSEEHTSELQSPDTISYAVFC